MQAGADPDRLPPPDPERVHRGDVHHEPRRARPARVAVAAGPGRDRQPELADEGQAGAHVTGAGAVGDAGRPLPVEPRVEQLLGHRVDPHPRPDQLVGGQGAAERLPVPDPRARLRRRGRAVTPAEHPGQRDRPRCRPGQREEAAPVRTALPIPGGPPQVPPRPGAGACPVVIRPDFAVHGCPQFRLLCSRRIPGHGSPVGATRWPGTHIQTPDITLWLGAVTARRRGLRCGKRI